MSHTFDIRFARSAGLAAIVQAPENSFRWKGGGLLQIDAEGVSIAVKRGLLSLFARKSARRIAAADLTEVYREGEALRLEFSTSDVQRAVMPFWVHDRDTAAEIVRLLPTRRTFEVDDAVQGSARRFRVDVRLVIWVLAALLVCLLGAAVLARYFAPSVVAAPTPAAAAPAISDAPNTAPVAPAPSRLPAAFPVALPRSQDLPASAAPAPTAPLPIPVDRPDALPFPVDGEEAIPVSDEATTSAEDARVDRTPTMATYRVSVRDGVVPIVAGQPGYGAARQQLDWFEGEVAVLRGQGSGTIGWWQLAVTIYNSEEFSDLELRPMLEAELAATRAWRAADHELAERLTARVSLYVR